MKSLAFVFCGALLVPVGISAQAVTRNVYPAIQAAVPDAGKPPGAPVREAMPQLSELERAKLENLQLKFQLLNAQQQQLQAAYSGLVQQIQAEHPGFVWDAGASTLRPVPKPGKPEPVKAQTPKP